jgi:hypothetical protein
MKYWITMLLALMVSGAANASSDDGCYDDDREFIDGLIISEDEVGDELKIWVSGDAWRGLKNQRKVVNWIARCMVLTKRTLIYDNDAATSDVLIGNWSNKVKDAPVAPPVKVEAVVPDFTFGPINTDYATYGESISIIEWSIAVLAPKCNRVTVEITWVNKGGQEIEVAYASARILSSNRGGAVVSGKFGTSTGPWSRRDGYFKRAVCS